VVGPSPRSGEAVTPPRSRLRPSPGVGRGGDRLPRSRLRPSPRVGRGGDCLPRSRLRPSPGLGRRPSSEVEAGAEPRGRTRQSFLWRLRLRLDLAAVSLTLVGGTAVGARQAALFFCQISQWRGEVTAVTSALPTEERASG
jgi:hypothetical protein